MPQSTAAPKSQRPPASAPKSRARLTVVPPLPKQPEPFFFQKRAADKARRLISQGANVVVASPTGSGKTVIAGITIRGIEPEDVISVSHSNALCDQLEERLCRSFT